LKESIEIYHIRNSLHRGRMCNKTLRGWHQLKRKTMMGSRQSTWNGNTNFLANILQSYSTKWSLSLKVSDGRTTSLISPIFRAGEKMTGNYRTIITMLHWFSGRWNGSDGVWPSFPASLWPFHCIVAILIVTILIILYLQSCSLYCGNPTKI